MPAGSPQNISITTHPSTASSANLAWKPPAKQHRNGDVLIYEILYHLITQPTIEWPLNVTSQSATIDHLLPDSEYIFQMRAYTIHGPGPWSNQVAYRTPNYRSAGGTNFKFLHASILSMPIL